MQALSAAEQVSRCIPLALGYGVILALFAKSQRDLERYRRKAETPAVPSKPVIEEQRIAASPVRLAARPLWHPPAARAELLRTYGRSETVPHRRPA